MTTSKRMGVLMIAGIIVAGASEIGERLSVPGIHSLISSAGATVGRPLTPVSVAGVARRNDRRDDRRD